MTFFLLIITRVLSILVVLLLSFDSAIDAVAETNIYYQKDTNDNLRTQHASSSSNGSFQQIKQQQQRREEEDVQKTRILQSTIPPVCTGVSDEESLVQAINDVPYNRFFASKITLCTDIQLTSAQNYNNSINFPYGNTKFDISNRNIAFICGRSSQSLQNKARCSIIGSSTTNMRLFYGVNTIVTSERIDYINGGNSNSNSGSRNNIVEKGGAFYIIGKSRILFRDTNFINNTVSHIGGAIYIDDTTQLTLSTFIGQSSRTTIASVNFINNFSNQIGGAIALIGSNSIFRTVIASGSTSITNTTLRIASFRNNIATNYGGAIAMTFQSQFPIFSSDITDNNNNNILTLSRLFFDDNKATVGGAIGGYDPDKVIIQSCVFTNNIASLTGGAIHSTSTLFSKLLSITSSENKNIFTNNTSIL